MRKLTMLFLVVAACRSASQRAAEMPGEAPVTTAPPTTVEPEVDPIPPIRGLDDALIGLLGIDQRGAPATVDAGAAVRFATLSTPPGGAPELTIHGFFDGALAAEHTFALPSGDGAPTVQDLAWRTEKELILLLSDGSLRKLDIDDGALAALARPAKKLFAAKKPAGTVEAMGVDLGLVATAGEVWIDHCAWGNRADADPCKLHVYVQVAPKAKASATAPTPRAPLRNDPALGWTLTAAVDDKGQPTDGVLHCAGPAGEKADLPAPDQSLGYAGDDTIWLSTRPAIALARVWFRGAAGPVAQSRFVARCQTSGAEPLRVVSGPDYFWTLGTREGAADQGGALLLWHGRVVGRLPYVQRVLFAP